MSKSNFTLIVLLIFMLGSCGQQAPKKVAPDNTQLLASALTNYNYLQADSLLPKIRMTENAQNIIKLYLMLETKNILKLTRELDYLQQFFPQMSFIHQSIINEIMIWVYLKQIYRDEISPPVRILQRDELYLAPSDIDFSTCEQPNTRCANISREKLSTLMTTTDITKNLKKMARKDPCVNLSSGLQDHKKANRCLRKSKGNLAIELLPQPHFSLDEWLQTISSL